MTIGCTIIHKSAVICSIIVGYNEHSKVFSNPFLIGNKRTKAQAISNESPNIEQMENVMFADFEGRKTQAVTLNEYCVDFGATIECDTAKSLSF